MSTLWMHATGAHDALGHHFGVRCNDEDVGRHLERVFAPLAAVGDVGEPEWYDVLVDGGHAQVWWRGAVAYDGSLALLVPSLHGHVNREAVEASDVIALHASAASLDGVTAVFPAPAESGKSTLVASLVLAGWSYLTDEVAAVDPSTGRVRPYRKAISIDRGSWDVVPELEPAIDPAVAQLRGDQWQVPVDVDDAAADGRVRLVVFPSYEEGATTALEEVGRAEAVTLLGASSFNLRSLGSEGLQQLAALARASRCYRLTIGGRSSACDVLNEVVCHVKPAGSVA